MRWPYSDEITAGVETQLAGAVRVGAMFYYRTNRDQFGDRNNAVPASAYTQHTVTIPNGPGGGPGTTNLQPTTVPVWNIPASLASADQTVRDNATYLDTEYKGVEFTATKRFSQKWQMQAGFTIGKNEGGFGGTDLNDPNRVRFPRGIIGNDSERALRLSGSYELPSGRSTWRARCSPTTATRIRLDLLADARGRGPGHHADPRHPDDPAERARRRALCRT